MIATIEELVRNVARCLMCERRSVTDAGRIACGVAERPSCHAHWRAITTNSRCPLGRFGTPLPASQPCCDAAETGEAGGVHEEFGEGLRLTRADAPRS